MEYREYLLIINIICSIASVSLACYCNHLYNEAVKIHRDVDKLLSESQQLLDEMTINEKNVDKMLSETQQLVNEMEENQ